MSHAVTSEVLEALPTKDGFRLRGLEMTRIETFTDAAFAFALTLLVISLEPARTFVDLRLALRQAPGFVVSATLLMMFWWGHNQWSRRFGLDDGVTVVLSCLLVFTVLVFVYPLRFMTGAFVSWLAWLMGLTRGAGEPMLSAPGDVNAVFAIYGVGFVGMCLALILLNLHAWRQRDALGLNAVERLDTRGELGAWTIAGAVGLLSVLLALAAPARWAGVPGWAYMLLPIIMPIRGKRMRRLRLRAFAGDS